MVGPVAKAYVTGLSSRTQAVALAEHLRHAIELAREARTRGNVPFESVSVGEAGATLAEGRNTVTTERGAPGHVETKLLRAVFRSLDAHPLTRSPTAGALLLCDNLTGKPKYLNRTVRKKRRVWSKDTGTCPE
jgi:hypothetical protein